jgi:hypothetical protein
MCETLISETIRRLWQLRAPPTIIFYALLASTMCSMQGCLETTRNNMQNAKNGQNATHISQVHSIIIMYCIAIIYTILD